MMAAGACLPLCRADSAADLTYLMHSLPVFIYIHGGGWVKAPPATSSFITRTSREVPCVMIVPRPRVAPEDPFPAPLEDVWGIVRWALDGSAEKELAALGEKGPGKVDWSKIALGGASAGGNLAAAIVGVNFLAEHTEDLS